MKPFKACEYLSKALRDAEAINKIFTKKMRRRKIKNTVAIPKSRYEQLLRIEEAYRRETEQALQITKDMMLAQRINTLLT